MTKEGRIKVMGFESAIKLNPGQNVIINNNDFCNFIFPPESKFSYESDLWAVGRIMYYLLLGCESFIDEFTNMNEFLKELPFNISKQAADCLRRLLEPNRRKRHKLNLIYMLPFFSQ